MTDRAHRLAGGEESRGHGLQLGGFEIGPHPLGMSSGKEQGVEIVGADLLVPKRRPEGARLRQCPVGGAAVRIRHQKRREKPEALPGEDHRIGGAGASVRRRDGDGVAARVEDRPGHTGLGRIEIRRGNGHQNGRQDMRSAMALKEGELGD